MIEKDHIFDKRIIERNMKRGRLTKAEYQEFLKTLPDDSAKAATVTVEIHEGEFKVELPEPVEEEE
jgi:hypothetical protein